MKRLFFLCLFTFACTCVRAQSPLPFTEDELKTGFAVSERNVEPPEDHARKIFTFQMEDELRLPYLIQRLNELLMDLPYEQGKLYELTVTEKKID
ncbi:hypothetical protein [Neolewinella agarilytica]|uniref:Uncharacterized protein n=1 Tax=Neolewinella agarilytica TaxID=478744 RepID=A0A1H9NA77_9BACT|nr:hypothetical protein [Neolewinella agarilytica]SER32788.1 hypothetical protein SAMN05444359_13523 [Neolewinella agarilytica]